MDLEDFCAKQLGCSVIMLAIKDANKKKDTYNRIKARNFLAGRSSEWLDSLKTWCMVADFDYEKIIKYAKAKGW